MENKIVNHVIYGKGTVVTVTERNDPIYTTDENGETKVIAIHKLCSIVEVQFEDGTIKRFQEHALKEPKWFVQDSEETVSA